MKVIMVCCEAYPFHYVYSGSPKYIYYLSKYLIKHGVDVEIVTSLNNGKERSEVYDNIKYTLLSTLTNSKLYYLRPLEFFLFSLRSARYLKKNSFDILHGFDMAPFFYIRFGKDVPVVYQPFGNEGFTIPSVTEGKPLYKTYHWVTSRVVWKYCGTNADVIAAEGEFQVDEIKKFYNVSQEKIFILPVGIDSLYIKESLKKKKISREYLGLKNDDFVLLSVNTLTPPKGVNYLIDAFYLLKQKIDNVKLIIIGSGSEEKKIIKKIRDYQLVNSIVHLKSVPENTIYEHFALSDLYVSPTLQSDFIMGILEAEVCGLPIVSTGQDWLVRNEINGYVIPPKDARAMAEAILKIYNKNEEDRKFMSIASQKIAKDYDFEEIAKRAIEQYHKLLKNR